MGNVRARTDAEVAARRAEILDATAALLAEQEYETVTLAAIAKKCSIARPSVYHYYATKEEVYLDLMRREYAAWATEIRVRFKRRMGREEFCRELADSLLGRRLILQLLAVSDASLRSKCGDEAIMDFQRDIHPFFAELAEVLRRQFPDAAESEREMFRTQLTMYSYSIYPLLSYPEGFVGQVGRMNLYGEVAPIEDLVKKGLMLLSAELP
ncbi:TetR/AcrR family transcriptional regulator [Actinomyces glycerinitolerans]|uniref:Tetr bacterial regulatory protein hth signature n=2 Tax=Actinomyces TaxID=1654 RepID=A0A1M4S099_9ACTO|nr:TetR/AcrR family transcriptional regulator [Actinomyces glycerinitolerans]SHE25611.1 tetr bacterial regulatory protein hth signature [Actinomyces glycerinitolerans]